jgi:cystathionine beta-lyase
MEAKLADGSAKLVMFCSPHNPCGRAWSVKELESVVALCRKYNVPLVCDEIHADFVYAPGEHHSILTIDGAADIAVMLCAASKTFNVAGLQQSAIVCKNEEMRKAIHDEMENGGVRSGNAFALAATRAVVAGEMSVLTDGVHIVSFDTVVKTMLETGHDLPRLYRETSVGGLSRFVRR